jgi:hypothetical protein
MKALTDSYNVTQILNTLTDVFVDVTGTDRDLINYGRCFLYADLAHTLIPEAEIISTYGHCFLKYDGRYYDSDMPDGKDSIYEIEDHYCTTWDGEVVATDEDALDYWRNNGNKDGRHLWVCGAFDKILNETLNVFYN